MQNHSSTMQLTSPISSENLMQSRLDEHGLQSLDVGGAGDRLDFRRSLVSGLPSPRREGVRGRSAGSFPEQRLVIEPMQVIVSLDLYHINYMAIPTIICVHVLLDFNL